MSSLNIITGIEARTMPKAENFYNLLAELCIKDLCKTANFLWY